MLKAALTKYGRMAPTMKKSVLRKWYKELTGDNSAALNMHEAGIDERVRLVLEMEDPNIILDLRALNSGAKSQYGTGLSVKNSWMKILELQWMTDNTSR